MKKLILIMTLVLGGALAFALPGFTPFVPDTAGEYVYYRDYSFERESYVGLLSYDETSYQIRYYAPADRELGLPELNLALLFSVNPESSFMDMTGERIITDVDPYGDDVDILNYLHDLLYEFSSRRIKLDELAGSEVFSSQEFEQFGGKVTMCFDSMIPLFNLKQILGPANEMLFSCVTFGRLLSSEDKSFDNFKGFVPAKEYHAPTKTKIKGKSKKYKLEDGQQITLDSNWTQEMENMWMYGEEAFISIASIPQYFEDQAMNDLYVLRRILESTDGSYTDIENAEFTFDVKNFRIRVITHVSQPEDKQVVYVVKQITTNPSKKVNSYLALSAYEDSYLAKSSYYTKLLKSFKD
ncbi:MAG: hypothetical protein J6T20_02890 [Treponema sp.]|nr:hypothetical protein [Treponema sp.]